MDDRHLKYPLQIDRRGHTATTDEDDHLRDMVEQVLFTNPGERVNLPDFGCGLRQIVFAPNGDVLAAATQFMVSHSLQKWLGDLIAVEKVEVRRENENLVIQIQFIKRNTLEKKSMSLST